MAFGEAVRAVQFGYTASEELSSLFEDFRLMCNDAIRTAVAYEKDNGEKVRSRFQLIELAHSRLKEYGLHSHYILAACEVAFAAYRNRKRTKNPYINNPFLKLDNQSYLLNHLILRIPSRPSRFIYLTLKGSDHHLSYVDDPALKRGSITLTPRSLSIALSKQAAMVEPLGRLGIDVNERNVTWSDSTGARVEDVSDVAEIRERYKAIRAKIGERTRQDRRVSKKLYAKYGRREKDRAVQRLHVVTKRIVMRAKEKRLGIVMEKLTGIRRLYRKGNGQGSSFRGRMSSWTFHEIQRLVEYKARWEGIPVTYVNPRGTSRKCPNCGSRVVPLAGRRLYCRECDITWDRDVLASKNITAAQVRAARPPRGGCEGEPRRQETAGNPPSGWVEASLSLK